jgi:hypothetical protein
VHEMMGRAIDQDSDAQRQEASGPNSYVRDRPWATVGSRGSYHDVLDHSLQTVEVAMHHDTRVGQGIVPAVWPHDARLVHAPSSRLLGSDVPIALAQQHGQGRTRSYANASERAEVAAVREVHLRFAQAQLSRQSYDVRSPAGAGTSRMGYVHEAAAEEAKRTTSGVRAADEVQHTSRDRYGAAGRSGGRRPGIEAAAPGGAGECLGHHEEVGRLG